MAKGDRWSDDRDVKVREMRNAETVLGVISERGRRRLPLEDIYRQLFNRDLFLRAYGRIYRNDGAMTPGATPETVDAMSLEKIDAIIDALRQERYRWTPVRRTYIPKKSGKLRPLGIPTWSDKLLQEVVRSLLNAYYEPQFSPHSHGFRPASRLPHRPRRDHPALERGQVVHRGRHISMFRPHRPPGVAVDPERETPRSTLPAVARQLARRRLLGGLEISRDVERLPARRCGQPNPLQHLPRQVGSVRRDGVDSSP